MKRKVLFIDRDGTLIHEPEDKQIDSLDKLSFIPFMFSTLSAITSRGEWDLVMVSNQDGLGTASFPEENFWPAQNKLLEALKNEGIEFKAIHIDRSLEYENLPTRKPGTAMLTGYFNDHYDLKNSLVIGDRITDAQLALNLGCKAILLEISNPLPATNPSAEECILKRVQDWRDIGAIIEKISKARTSEIRRTTTETDILINVDLDGTGHSNINTGLGFFDHMLQQIARHGSIDLDVSVKGDLHIDEHHTIEDTALTLGSAIAKALGSKRGIARYGFCLPMDDCLAQVAIDFGGRPWLVWDAEFKREKVGDMPTEMFFHFFKSFSDAAGCNLNIKAEGQNEHHKIESIFKAFARSVKMAKAVESDQLPTTKGVL
ncbi:MAG: bifunctional histidinol-phosphatase/imidazoleglycerol-phosphate dehydratase HisB [Cyclobacteriaceae bacterium]